MTPEISRLLAEAVELAETGALDESVGKTIKQGWKMVFGKLRKLLSPAQKQAGRAPPNQFTAKLKHIRAGGREQDARRRALLMPRFEAEERETAAAVIIRKEGKVLLLKRGMTAPWMPGHWNLPGGTTDPGETPAQTAAREAEEEVSIKVRGLQKLSFERFPDFDLTIFTTDSFSGEPRMTWENSEMEWVVPEEALTRKLVPGIAGALKKVAQMEKKR